MTGVKFYINEKEVDRSDFERQCVSYDIDWIIDTMVLNKIKYYKRKSPYNKILEIIII